MALYIHSHIRLHGVVLNLLSTGTSLPFTVLCTQQEIKKLYVQMADKRPFLKFTLILKNSLPHRKHTTSEIRRLRETYCDMSTSCWVARQGLRSGAMLGSRPLNNLRSNTRSGAVGEAVCAPCRVVPSGAAPSAARQQAR
jgi:hypothetical protein